MKHMRLAMVLAAAAIFSAGCGGSSSPAPVPPGPAGDAVVSVTPADGATGIPVTQAITVAFSKDLDATTLTAANITLTRSNGLINVPGAIAYDAASKTLTFTPTRLMVGSTPYAFTIKAAAVTKATGDFATTFTTQTVPMLLLSTLDPANPAGFLPTTNVWTMNPDGTGLTDLTGYTTKAAGSFAFQAAWSPDYSRIAYLAQTGDPSDRQDLYVMNADGTGLTNLTKGAVNYKAQVLKWAPDGSRVYFLYTLDDSAPNEVDEIGSVALDGSAPVNLTNVLSGMSVITPLFDVSPDGTKIAFSIGPSTTDAPNDLYVMNSSDGMGQTRLTSMPATDKAIYPKFSPDGTKIYYVAGSSAAGIGLYYVNLDVSGVQTILPPVVDRGIIPGTFSPDGTQLAAMIFTKVGPDSLPDVYLVAHDGSTSTRLTTTAGGNIGLGASWSPDGSRISYLYGDLSTSGGSMNLFVANRDGSSPVNLTNYPADTRAFDVSIETYGFRAGQWSPDGTQIFFTKLVKIGGNMNGNIEVAKVDGSGLTSLTNTAYPQIVALLSWW